MGYYLLHDPRQERAVIYDSNREEALPVVSFLGVQAEAHGESFLGFLHTRAATASSLVADDFAPPPPGRFPDTKDPRSYSQRGLATQYARWRVRALKDDMLTEYGVALADWFDGDRVEPPPEPALDSTGAVVALEPVEVEVDRHASPFSEVGPHGEDLSEGTG